MSLLKKITTTAAVMAAAGTLVATEAYATEGYFQNAIGARHKGLAGAGVADTKDATAITLNPAGLVHAGRQFNGAISIFMPFREYSATLAPGFVVPGSQKSDRNWFPVPNIAYSHPISDTTTLGFSVSGNGGMNSTYKSIGPFGAGKTGIDLTQMNISAGIATRLGKYVSVGVAPIFAIQRFKAKGLAPFVPFSVRPGNLTNRGYDYAVGGGARFGVEVELDENIRVGASYQTKLLTSRFSKYSGLFAENGDFNIPSHFQVGVAFDVTPDLTFMADYRYINYSEIASINNPFPSLGQLGTANGHGFGWKDTQTIKFGVEYNATEDLTVRAGYSYNTAPIPKSEVTFNILAPATVKHHITGGASYKYSPNSELEFAVMFAPNASITGPTSPFQTATIKMHQLEVTVGYNYHW